MNLKELEQDYFRTLENIEDLTDNKEINDYIKELASLGTDMINTITELASKIDAENKIDYDTLVYYLKLDNKYAELENWLENYMKFYNKTEESGILY